MQFTGRLLFEPAGESGYINFGDLAGHKREFKREGVKVQQAEKGYHRDVRNLTSLVSAEYEFKLREQTKLNFGALILSGGVYLSDTQLLVTAPSGTATFNGVAQGRSYVISAKALNTVVVTVSAAQKVEGVDYTIDLGSGELYIIPGGGIAGGANVGVTFGNAALDGWDHYRGLYSPGDMLGSLVMPALKMTGGVKLFEFDQHVESGVQRRLHTFNGNLWFEGSDEQDGQKPSELTLKVLATDKPTIQILK